MLKRIPRRTHITPRFERVSWLRNHDRIIFKILLLTHKAVNNTAPEYLCDLIRLNVKSTTIRARASFYPCLLCVPPISKTCANSFFDISFVYAAPTLRNALVVVVVCLLQPSSSVKSGCPGPESSILVSSRWACPISSQVTDHWGELRNRTGEVHPVDPFHSLDILI